VGGDTVDFATPGDYTITYNATDGTNAAAEVTRTVTVVDPIPPLITLNGDATVTVECGGAYTDEGATASDFCEGTVSVTVGGDTVDTDAPGDYTITYNATDGTNPATEVTRTVTVEDPFPPVITLNGDATVTVECGGAYTDEGATASDACEGTVTVDFATPGDYTITYNATDGTNPATEVTRIVTVEDNCPPDGEGEGEGSADIGYDQLLQAFAAADANDDKLLTLAEIQSVLPGFTQLDLDDADYNGDGELSVAELLQRVGGGILFSADTDGDSIVQLNELLRLIQLFNAGQYACAENAGATEDGFSLSAALNEPACVLHSVDQNGDKVISLSELLRGIQLYNLGGYTWCPTGGTEDGFCG
jgi:hypothetical protein